MSNEEVVIIEPHEELIVARVAPGSLDEESTRRMQDEVLAAAEKARHLPVALDLSRVAFFPSLSLGAVVSILMALKEQKQPFMLLGPQSSVRESLTITRLDRLFEIHENLDDALVHLRENRGTGA